MKLSGKTKTMQSNPSMYSIKDTSKRNDKLKINGKVKKCIMKLQNLKMQSKL